MAKKKYKPRASKGQVTKELYEQYVMKYEKAQRKLSKQSKSTASMIREAAKWTREDEDNQFYLEYIRARNDLIAELKEQNKSTVGVNSQVIIRRMVRQATTPVSEGQAERIAEFFKERNWTEEVSVPVSSYTFKRGKLVTETLSQDEILLVQQAKMSGAEFITIERTPTAEDILFSRVDLTSLRALSQDDKRLSELYHELVNSGMTRAKAGEYISYYVYGSD